MALVAVRLDVHRGYRAPSWLRYVLPFAVAALASAAIAGYVLGEFGSRLSADLIAAVATAAGLVGASIAIADVFGWRVPVPQFDRETPRRWEAFGTLPVLNGAALGLGITTRIGFWLWFAVPLAALLAQDGGIGALIFGAYGCTRGLATAAFVACTTCGRRTVTHERLARSLLLRKPSAQRLSAAYLLALATATVAVFG